MTIEGIELTYSDVVGIARVAEQHKDDLRFGRLHVETGSIAGTRVTVLDGTDSVVAKWVVTGGGRAEKVG